MFLIPVFSDLQGKHNDSFNSKLSIFGSEICLIDGFKRIKSSVSSSIKAWNWGCDADKWEDKHTRLFFLDNLEHSVSFRYISISACQEFLKIISKLLSSCFLASWCKISNQFIWYIFDFVYNKLKEVLILLWYFRLKMADTLSSFFWTHWFLWWMR